MVLIDQETNGCKPVGLKAASPTQLFSTAAAKVDVRKTEAFREAARDRARAQWTPQARAAHSELMRSPEVRERSVAGTKLAKEQATQLDALQTAWRRAHESMRLQFFAGIIRSNEPHQ
ncbi:MAG: hypothetical protein ACLPTZ_24005 [Beijerinckiaceae bacterium]